MWMLCLAFSDGACPCGSCVLSSWAGAEGTSVAAEALNERAVAVIRRVNAKLTGRDFGEVRERVLRVVVCGCVAFRPSSGDRDSSTLCGCCVSHFLQNETFEVPDQVQRLILKATSVENLCQGWVVITALLL